MSAKKKKKAHPWRENIEAVTVSVIIIVLFKYFVLEAYKIPTGSMQPTLMGWSDPEGGGVFDRVLVDKLSFHYRDPERFEIVVFKYPLDRSKNFIKRIVGMPNEELEIREGDLWIKPEGEEWRALRRPRRIQDAQLKELDSAGEWALDDGWREEGGGVIASRPGRAQFPRTTSTVKDHFTDGYPASLRDAVRRTARNSGHNDVPDLRLAGRVEAQADTTEVSVVFSEGDRRLELVIPGPAAPEDARPRAVLRIPGSGEPLREVEAKDAYRLRAGKSVSFLAQNLDDLLELEIGGDSVLAVEVPPVEKHVLATRGGTGIDLVTSGGGAAFTRLDVARDIYYTSANMARSRWTIPDGAYVMLGDNTQDSSDARDWALWRYEIHDGPLAGEVIDGNHRGEEAPRIVRGAAGEPTRVYFHDQQGERRVFDLDDATGPQTVPVSHVPRRLIRGRAVLVVWPVFPTFRPKWVR